MASEADTREHLRALVEALEGAFISTWQSTAAWQKELDAAREYLSRPDGVPAGFRSVGSVNCHVSGELDLAIGTELFIRTQEDAEGSAP